MTLACLLFLTGCPMFVQIHAAFITGREFLEPGQSETQGYGLYSYVLLGNRPPDDRTRARYLAVLRRYLLIERAEDFPPEVFVRRRSRGQ